MQATIKNIKEVITEADVLGNVTNIENNIPLVEQGIDSLDIVNIYLLLEEKFDIKIPDEDLKQVDTIDNIITYVNNKLG